MTATLAEIPGIPSPDQLQRTNQSLVHLDGAECSTASPLPTASTQRQYPQVTCDYRQAPSALARHVIGQMQITPGHRILKPAPPRTFISAEPKRTDFFDLPAELRIEIYKLVLDSVVIHILPLYEDNHRCPHALVLTSRQVRNEVLPIIHSTCAIRANVTDFNFSGLLAWMERVPPDQQAHLCKNRALTVRLCTSLKPAGFCENLRKWLHLRADLHRPQPDWEYSGPTPKNKVANDLRRRVKRMPEEGKRQEMAVMLGAIGVRAA
ncbi:hypothetical protein LTR36_007259 [Oleoguttula mirabilis]|uniref:Uncharacterized protein n=1 Tax=Oleoguttula mirabilis TaxID=1507867 RepID=A0AAV9J9Z2_9PEZI|nr:hypothetical protein LTR36_007259 [Oleoguttula mirabilis]